MRNIVNIDYSDTGGCGSSSFAYDCNELYLIIKPGENQKTGIQIETTDTSGQVYTEAIEPVGGLIQVQVPETLWNTAGTMKIRLLSNEGNTEYTQFVCVDVNSMDVCCKYSGGTFRFYLYGENIQYYAGSDTDGGPANSVKNGADSYLQFNTGVENTSDTWLLVQRDQFIEHRSADNLPYIPRGGVYTSDLDTCYTTGIYLYTPDTNGRPDEYGHVFITVSDGDTYNGTSNWIRQIAYGTNGEIFSRQKTNEEAWTEWKKLVFEDDIRFTYSTSEQWTGKYDPSGRKIYCMYVGEYDATNKTGSLITFTKTFSSEIQDVWFDMQMSNIGILADGNTIEYKPISSPSPTSTYSIESVCWLQSDRKTLKIKNIFGSSFSQYSHKYIHVYILYTYK